MEDAIGYIIGSAIGWAICIAIFILIEEIKYRRGPYNA